ncbi:MULTISPECIES: helix-turn-helix domain-containing protein [Saliphagus]|uniref:Helix-turn-helix domain-containing protein n=1 Tax=Saliphagus infecundisoli TaxID=1849069 RepID=A0ABD5Q9B2_9EURY|nr:MULTISPECIES: helix-turn-helix domain-containing protein [Saliphagus]
MYEATFSIPDSSPYTEPTDGTDCRIDLWCNDHADLLSVRGEVGAVVERVRTDVGIDGEIRTGTEAVVVTSACLREQEPTIERYLQPHGCLLLPPLRYADGAKHCRVLALDSASLADLYAALVDDGLSIDVRSKREVHAPTPSSPLVSVEGVLPELTARQREVLALAVSRGYYELPRETTTAELAAELGVGRRTAEDHLRRAEGKLLPALVSYLY